MQPEIRIVDLGEAAVLMTHEVRLVRLESSRKGNHKIFVFERPELGDGAISPEGVLGDYKAHKLLVDPYTFFLNQKELKSKIHQMEDQA
jgi:hypothetical protein